MFCSSVLQSIEEEQNSIVDEVVTVGVIFVSQVVAAVAALHERSLLEDKVNALLSHQPLNNYQRYTSAHFFIHK